MPKVHQGIDLFVIVTGLLFAFSSVLRSPTLKSNVNETKRDRELKNLDNVIVIVI